MASSSTSALLTNDHTSKVLLRQEQWDDWLDQTRSHMVQLGVWEYMDIEHQAGAPPIPEPLRPIPPTVMECIDAKAAVIPDVRQKAVLDLMDLCKFFQTLHSDFATSKEKAIKYLGTHVDSRWQYILSKQPTLLGKMQTLQRSVAPSMESRRNALRIKYTALQGGKLPNTSMSTHLYQWELLERRMSAYNMPECAALKFAFTRSIAQFHEGIYNMLRSAGNISLDELPELDTMIEIVRTEMGVRAMPDIDRPGATKGHSAAAYATFQDNDDAATKTRKGKGRGCGFITKKPADKECAFWKQCNVINAELWPREIDRDAGWKTAMENYKRHCWDNKSFCDRAANHFKNPAAAEVWAERFAGGKSTQPSTAYSFTGATILGTANASASQQNERHSHWLFDNCANSHVVNDVRRADFTVTHLPEDSFVAAGSSNFRVVAVGNCTLQVPHIGGGTFQLTLLDVPYVPGFHTNIISELKLKKAGLWYHGLHDQIYHAESPLSQLVRHEDALPCLDISTPLRDTQEAITVWPKNGNGEPLTVKDAYHQACHTFT